MGGEHEIVSRLRCMAEISPDGQVTRLVPGGRDLINEAAVEITALRDRAEKAEAERDAAQAQVAMLGPDFRDLMKCVRRVVREENKHLKGGDSSTRLAVDTAYAALIDAFPAGRLDELQTALSDTAQAAADHDRRVLERAADAILSEPARIAGQTEGAVRKAFAAIVRALADREGEG